MNVVNDYIDVLQNIEFAIVSCYKEHPEMRDPMVIQATEKLISAYAREKKRLPALPVNLPPLTMLIYEAIQDACERRLTRELSDGTVSEEDGYLVPLRIIIICLDRVLKSENTWHKRDGQRGYLDFVATHV